MLKIIRWINWCKKTVKNIINCIICWKSNHVFCLHWLILIILRIRTHVCLFLSLSSHSFLPYLLSASPFFFPSFSFSLPFSLLVSFLLTLPFFFSPLSYLCFRLSACACYILHYIIYVNMERKHFKRERIYAFLLALIWTGSIIAPSASPIPIVLVLSLLRFAFTSKRASDCNYIKISNYLY